MLIRCYISLRTSIICYEVCWVPSHVDNYFHKFITNRIRFFHRNQLEIDYESLRIIFHKIHLPAIYFLSNQLWLLLVLCYLPFFVECFIAYDNSLIISYLNGMLNLKLGLADHDNYHEFCRLLGRFRVNYQVFSLSIIVTFHLAMVNAINLFHPLSSLYTYTTLFAVSIFPLVFYCFWFRKSVFCWLDLVRWYSAAVVWTCDNGRLWRLDTLSCRVHIKISVVLAGKWS